MTIPLDLARKAARLLCDRNDVELVLPGDVRREAVLYALAAEHAITHSGWDLATARERVSVTLPSLPQAITLAGQLPAIVGAAVGAVLKTLRRDAIFLAPAAWNGDGPTLLGVIAHELGHRGEMERARRDGGDLGRALWCIAYGTVAEVRAGAEAPCYGCDVAMRVRYGGVPVDAAVADACDALAAHGLGGSGSPEMALARAALEVTAETLRKGGDPGGMLADMDAILAEVSR